MKFQVCSTNAFRVMHISIVYNTPCILSNLERLYINPQYLGPKSNIILLNQISDTDFVNISPDFPCTICRDQSTPTYLVDTDLKH